MTGCKQLYLVIGFEKVIHVSGRYLIISLVLAYLRPSHYMITFNLVGTGIFSHRKNSSCG